MRAAEEEKQGLHPRNRHRGRYDFAMLAQACPELARFVRPNPYGDTGIDFADPDAVRALNRALLKHFYGIEHWDLPPGHLCPPIPGRADYLHHSADLLGGARGASVRVLDIGVGASCIYPILGHREYGWSFLGSDIDPGALAVAGRILQANPGLEGAIELRLQPTPGQIFQGLLRDGERFALSICNPPFHASPEEARAGARSKLRNLGIGGGRLNFGGRAGELWCAGGEAGFVRRMIQESALIPDRCRWFSSLISKSSNLPGLRQALRQAGARDTRTLAMAQGQKQSRILAWTFLP